MGLLERLPQRINERPPCYLGRDYLETLMASQTATDWIRIRYPGSLSPGGGGARALKAVGRAGPRPDRAPTRPPHSEMLLGPVPPNFIFLPKHKANAYK